MVAFRRIVVALGILALFVGLAGAQTNGGGTGQLTCSTNVAVTPMLRSEGYTEQTGDIVITCTGGAAMTPGQSIPLVNITLTYSLPVTSRLLTGSVSGSGPNPNEALLLIDEPQSNLGGDGPLRPQVLCTTPLTGCPAWVGFASLPVGGSGLPTAVTAAGGTTMAPNVYQGTTPCPGGTCNTSQVTFFGVPALPPTTTGSRVYRITNVRVNANAAGTGAFSGAVPVSAGVSISGATSLSISNANPVVGFINSGLSTSAKTSNNPFKQCVGQNKVLTATLTYNENFGTAFKTRVLAQANTANAGQNGTLPGAPAAGNQATPGAIYNSESNFVFPIGSAYAGLADYGTRLKASFTNIPVGARLWVSTNNTNGTLPGVIGGSAANAGTTGWAQLVNGEATSDGSGVSFPGLTTTDTIGGVGAVEIALSGGAGTAVWEILNTNPNTQESYTFTVYISYTPNIASNFPPPGDSFVAMSYAPTSTSGNATAGVLPRFIAGTTNTKIMSVNVCRTILLYPYLTNQVGFDTGVTVANTTVDPFGTAAQPGSCKLNWYGGTTATPTSGGTAYDTGAITPGTVWANTLGVINPTFQGYMIAVCTFQYAHGFAFISDVGAQKLAMGYLAVVLNDDRALTNTVSAENGGH